MTDQPQSQIQIDARDILTVLQQTHPEAVQSAVWQVRAMKAEEEREQLRARVAELEAPSPTE
jgi:hypothetical protein